MTRGCRIAVTAVPLMNQCADTARMARGRGNAAPRSRQAWVKAFISSVFIGEPCPMNAAGILLGSGAFIAGHCSNIRPEEGMSEAGGGPRRAGAARWL